MTMKVGAGTWVGSGAWNCRTGRLARAWVMNALHIRAGKLPPTTLMPSTSRMGTSPSGSPIHTAVVRSGVYPTNHASW